MSLRVDDAYELPTPRTFFLELDVPVFLRKKRMVTTDANIDARMKARTTLANDNVARYYFLAAIDLDA